MIPIAKDIRLRRASENNLDRQLYLRLKEKFRSQGHPLCPDCGEIDDIHEEDCIFQKMLIADWERENRAL